MDKDKYILHLSRLDKGCMVGKNNFYFIEISNLLIYLHKHKVTNSNRYIQCPLRIYPEGDSDKKQFFSLFYS